MKLRFLFQQGVWYCVGDGAWGSGRSLKLAWRAWLWDLDGG